MVDLKKSHRRLFDRDGNKVVTRRKIGYTSDLTLIEGNLRLLIKDPDIKKKNLAFFLELLHRYSGENSSDIQVRGNVELGFSHAVLNKENTSAFSSQQVYITANVILEKTEEDGSSTYSVYYGEVFDSSAKIDTIDEDSVRGFEPKGSRQDSMCIAPRFSASTAEEFNLKYPTSFKTDDVAEIFKEALGDSSNVTVHSILNVVSIYFQCIDSYKSRGSSIASQPPRMT